MTFTDKAAIFFFKLQTWSFAIKEFLARWLVKFVLIYIFYIMLAIGYQNKALANINLHQAVMDSLRLFLITMIIVYSASAILNFIYEKHGIKYYKKFYFDPSITPSVLVFKIKQKSGKIVTVMVRDNLSHETITAWQGKTMRYAQILLIQNREEMLMANQLLLADQIHSMKRAYEPEWLVPERTK